MAVWYDVLALASTEMGSSSSPFVSHMFNSQVPHIALDGAGGVNRVSLSVPQEWCDCTIYGGTHVYGAGRPECAERNHLSRLRSGCTLE